MKTRKILALSILTLLLLAAVFAFSSCKKETGPCTTHTWGEYVETSAATCKDFGTKTRTCTVCGATEKANVERMPHTYTETVEPPTCTEKGKTIRVCSVCGDTYEVPGDSALGHDYQSTVTAPTCTAKGYTSYKCSRCEHSYIDQESYVDMIPHDYGDSGVVTAPTCTTGGYTTYTCQECSYQHVADRVDPLPHAYAQSSVVTEPTCDTAGYTTCTCVCGKEIVRNVTAPLGHTLTWGEDGTATCSVCQKSVPASKGIEYALNAEETGYIVKGFVAAADKTTHLIIPNKYNGKPVVAIAARAFAGEDELLAVELPATITEIGADAFFACSALGTIKIDAANTVYATENNSLYTKTGTLLLARDGFIPATVTTIAKYAFAYSPVESVAIPASVAVIEPNAFYRTPRLAAITVAQGNAVYTAAGNCVIETATKTLVLGCRASVIPTDDSVTTIASYAFAYIRSMTELTIPDNITKVCQNAFIGCTLLIEEIEGAFYVDNWLIDCDEMLSTLSVKATLRGFAEGSLNGCTALRYIYFGASLADWNKNVIRFEGWDVTITIVCEDYKIVDGVEKPAEDSLPDIFD